MLQILFSESAEGSLKCGRNFGKGEYKCNTEDLVGVILGSEDSMPDEDLLEELKKDREARERTAWESAEPIDINAEDIFGLPLGLSEGDISGSSTGETRIDVMKKIFDINDGDEQGEAFISEICSRAEQVKKRLAEGEDACIWYSSSQPDDLCGLFMTAALAEELGAKGDIYLIECPRRIERNGETVSVSSWGEIEPGEWNRFWKNRKKAEPALLEILVEKWRELKRENSPLRVCINGELHSVSDSFYDSLIEVYISAMDKEFSEAYLINEIIAKGKMAVSDTFIAGRIEKMIEKGLLEADTRFPEGRSFYRRTLIKKDI